MKILIGGSSSKIFHLNEFKNSLEKLDVKTKVVNDTEIVDRFPSRNLKNCVKPFSKIDEIIAQYGNTTPMIAKIM